MHDAAGRLAGGGSMPASGLFVYSGNTVLPYDSLITSAAAR
jgi:hypothetical protein